MMDHIQVFLGAMASDSAAARPQALPGFPELLTEALTEAIRYRTAGKPLGVPLRASAADEAPATDDEAPPVAGMPGPVAAPARPAEERAARSVGSVERAERPATSAPPARSPRAGRADLAVSRADADPGRLDPALRSRLDRVVRRMREEHGHQVSLVEGHRSPERQAHLFAQGRTRPGPVVTWTLSSAHQTGRAADLIVDGSYDNPIAYRRLQKIAAEEGLRTLGPKDPGHVELPRGPGDRTHRAPDPRGGRNAAPGQARTLEIRPGTSAPTRPAVAGLAAPAAPAAPARMASPVAARPAAIAMPAPVAGARRAAVGGAREVATTPPAPGEATPRQSRPGIATRGAGDPADHAAMRTSSGRATEAAPSADRQPEPQVRLAGQPIGRQPVTSEPPPSRDAGPQPRPGSVDARATGTAPEVIAAAREARAEGVERPTRRPVHRTRPAATAEGNGATRGVGTERPADAAVPTGPGVAGRGPGPVGGAETVLGATQAERIEAVDSLREQAESRPVQRVSLRVGEGGDATRVRVDLRTAQVRAEVTTGNERLSDLLTRDLPDLARALDRRGLDPESLLVRRGDGVTAGELGVLRTTEPGRGSGGGTVDRDHQGTSGQREPREERERPRGDGQKGGQE